MNSTGRMMFPQEFADPLVHRYDKGSLSLVPGIVFNTGKSIALDQFFKSGAQLFYGLVFHKVSAVWICSPSHGRGMDFEIFNCYAYPGTIRRRVPEYKNSLILHVVHNKNKFSSFLLFTLPSLKHTQPDRFSFSSSKPKSSY